MNRMRNITTCGILAASLAASVLSGCGQVDGTKTALVVNDEEINLGTAAFFLRYQQAETTTLMQNYGMAQEGSNFWSNTYAAATSSTEAQTYGENLKEQVRESLVEAVVLNQHAGDYDVTIPDELQTSLDDTAEDTYSKNKDALDEMGSTEDDVKHVLELSTIQRLMYYPMVADTDTNVSDEDAAESTITYARIALTKYDSDTQQTNAVSDEDKETYKTEMQELLDQVKASGDTAAADMTTMASNLDSTNIACTTYSYGKDDTVMPEEVLDAAATLSDGEIYDGVIDTGDYYYLVRMDKVFDQEATDSNKQTIIQQRQQENYQDKLDGWVKEATVEEESPWKKLEVTDAHGYAASVNTDNVVSASDYASSSESVSSGSAAESASSVSGSSAAGTDGAETTGTSAASSESAQ